LVPFIGDIPLIYIQGITRVQLCMKDAYDTNSITATIVPE